jgi:hypothetical protein
MPNRGTRTSQHIRTIRKSLRTLDRTLRRLAVSVAKVRPGPMGTRRRKLTLTPARRAALKLQGQYMGYMRKLKPKQKAQVKAVREKMGIRAAIGAARRMGTRS